MKKVVWGILGTARIGVNKVIPGMLKSDRIEVRAIASRNLETAQTAAGKLGIPVAYGSYEALINDPEIEAIYNPLPNHLHVPMTLAAAKAGKHVLCEKPMALNAAELDQLDEVAGKVHIMEGFMVRHTPLWQDTRWDFRNGLCGRPHIMTASFTYANDNPDDIRNKVEWGGGGLMDIGCYAIVAGRFFFEAEPVRAIALVSRDVAFGTDAITSGILDFGNGRHLTFAVSTSLAGSQNLTIIGEKGRIQLPVPYNQPPGGPSDIWTDAGGQNLDGTIGSARLLPAYDQYTLMADDFSRAVRGEIPLPYGLDDARANMRVIDALFRSEQSCTWEYV